MIIGPQGAMGVPDVEVEWECIWGACHEKAHGLALYPEFPD